MAEISKKPYLVRAIYEWCTDNGYRPHLAVAVDERTVVPREYVRNGEIVLNLSAEATNRLRIGNELIEFEARFNRVAREVSIPIENVTAIYAAENGNGMMFQAPKALEPLEPETGDESGGDAQTAVSAPRGPALLEAVRPPVPESGASAPTTPEEPTEPPPGPPSGRPHLTRVK